jgi:hypothetical protein
MKSSDAVGAAVVVAAGVGEGAGAVHALRANARTAAEL